MSLNEDDYIILPRTISLDQAETKVSYETQNENQAAVITYSYQGMDLGTVRVNFAVDNSETYVFDTLPEVSEAPTEDTEEKEEPSVVFVNVIRVLSGLGIAIVAIFLFILGRSFFRNYAFSKSINGGNRNRWKSVNNRNTRNKNRNRRRKKHPNRFRDYDF